jgi:hypothetical protein
MNRSGDFGRVAGRLVKTRERKSVLETAGAMESE